MTPRINIFKLLGLPMHTLSAFLCDSKIIVICLRTLKKTNMNEQEQLALYYKETKDSLNEQRRVIDYDMRNHLAQLEKDRSTEGNLRVLRYKSEIQQAEVVCYDRASELKDIDDDLRPILKEINAHRDDPFKIKVGNRSYFDTYISEDGEIIATGTYTKVS
jgi:hypothetical protein